VAFFAAGAAFFAIVVSLFTDPPLFAVEAGFFAT
jgi:hypothetical protein